MSTFSHVRGLGFHVPERLYTNADLEKIVDTNDEWITSRTGIKQRHVVENETCLDLAHGASVKALADAGMDAEELTHVIVATFTGDMPVPATSCLLLERLGIKNIAAMDLSAACSGFVYAIEVARALINLDPAAKILICGAEIVTSRVNWEDRTTCVLFGDGAGAAVLTAGTEGEPGKVIDTLVRADGGPGMNLTVKGGGSAYPYKLGQTVGAENFVEMQGREIYRFAVRSMTAICNEILAKHGLCAGDIDVLLPHQANLRIIEAVGKKLGVEREKVFVNVDKYGNTSAASIPIGLADAKESGFIKPGDLVLLTTFGGGLTWGATLIRF
ncbi:beta-ketoacyl-ACP synthase III [Maridesulfovibrio hydrothermalis]|uniref:Beta-ketoacyl-[acyl-carrier-protein] synthase III n=1 Tax=Maridesulfovibrio hydrothermalis AM13 = DSM 14728 TaxID=1121451 RepID=L0R8I4_9BACT|nr:beta-ketoacyl-ACP synthase III [Maridesulfovibrio hydrothermalis]CCO22532.1 3-oxoacyl-[acyl-carrier-protein] synthase 3 [Maridesulfovibrio hydrothermalis AM13 = DSM 14728]